MANDKPQATTATTTTTTPPKQGDTPPDPLKPIQERQAAAEAPTKAVESGEIKPPQPTQEKKPSLTGQMTGPEQMQVTTSGMEGRNPAGPPAEPGQGPATKK